MDGFSIDDVRDTIGADISRFLERIENTANHLAEPQPSPKNGHTPTFQMVSDAGHAIYGTSSLVGADSLATSAKLIERLADQGAHEIALSVKHLERARDIAAALRQGAGEMRTMLSLELEHQGDDAGWIAREWQTVAHQLLAALAEIPNGEAAEAKETADLLASIEPADPMLDELRGVFVEEAREITGGLKAQLSLLREDPTDIGAARALERLYHTLKGAAATVGLAPVSDAAANLQDRLQQVVDDGVPGTDDLVNELIADTARLIAGVGLAEAFEVTSALPMVEADAHQIPQPDPELWSVFNEECTELLEGIQTSALAIEETEHQRETLTDVLPRLHTLKGVVNTMGMTPTGSMLHRVEDLVEQLVERDPLPERHLIASFLLEVHGEVRRNLEQAKTGWVESSLAGIDAAIAQLSHAPLEVVPQLEEELPEHPADEVTARRFVRVGADRLDNLMNLAGELVVSRSRLMSRVQTLRNLHLDLGRGSRRLTETADRFSEEHEFALLGSGALVQPLALAAGAESFSELELDRYEDVNVLSRTLAELTSDFGEVWKTFSAGLEALTDDSDAFGGIVSGIRSEVTRARMVPMEVLFAQLRLPIRDAASREGKQVRVTTQGADVHLDKTIADGLLQPMLHLVRNAVAHGFQQEGTIELIAREEMGQIVLEVRDDGAGLNLEKLRERGLQMGLIAESVLLDDPALKELVFAPGLSTEDSARDVAGRGLGCDFVRRSIERLNGTIKVESQAGLGTNFILTLPVTLAITKALLVRQGEQSFALPLYYAERILDAEEQETLDAAGKRRVRVDDVYLPISDLSSLLGFEAIPNEKGPIVVVRLGSERMAIQVDSLAGQEEVVVKNLGALLTGHPLFAGVTIRGTGEMVLILDVPGLIEARHVRVVRPKARPRIGAVPQRPVAVAKVAEREKLRVLFVDDSLSVRKVAERMLQALDVEVTLAIDGVDALAKIRETSFDMVFTDLEMPRMHGFELIRELRFLVAYQDLPIVVVTSRSARKHKDHASSLGASEYLTKPFTPQSLELALEKWGRSRRNVPS